MGPFSINTHKFPILQFPYKLSINLITKLCSKMLVLEASNLVTSFFFFFSSGNSILIISTFLNGTITLNVKLKTHKFI